ncbi:hypothetical protein RB200_02795 [Streptomyces sp. PmtG]
MCEAAPEGSVLRFVQRHGDTMLNELQLERFVAELERLPEEEKNTTVRKLIAAARFAIASHGYLYFVGEAGGEVRSEG